MNYGSKGATKMTAGVDLGDKYSYLFVLHNDSGEVVEEGRLRTTPEDLRRRFECAERMNRAPKQRALPTGDRVAQAGSGSGSTDIPYLCPDPGGSREVRKEPQRGSLSWSRCGQGPIRRE
jgi:hypothetical protein